MNRPTRQGCAGCGVRTKARNRECPDCEVALHGGRWVPVGGVLRWVTDDVDEQVAS